MRSPVSEATGAWGAIQRFWQRSYAADYVGFVLLVSAYIFVSSDQEQRQDLQADIC